MGVTIIMLGENTQAPDFCLADQDNQATCLKEYKGSWVVLYFYPKDNTPGCTLEAKGFSYKEDDFKTLNAKVIGISPDSCESHKKFQNKHDLTVTLLSDAEHKVLQQYDVWKPKKLYGKEFLGVIRTTFILDPEGKIRHVWNKVKVPGHIDEVITKLKNIQTEG